MTLEILVKSKEIGCTERSNSQNDQNVIRNKTQLLIGIVTLFIGVLVYFLDRDLEHVYFMNLLFDFRVFTTIPKLFGIIGNSLPDFLHPFSFILITAGLISTSKKNYLCICISWCLLECLFELGQKFKNIWFNFIPNWIDNIFVLENAKIYFLSGTFDECDLIAAVLGSVIAYAVLLLTSKRSIIE